MTSPLKPSGVIVVFLLFSLLAISVSTPSNSQPNSPSTSTGSRRPLAYVGRRKTDTLTDPTCKEMGSREECLGKSSRCRWCRSDALDDMCFGFSEAWRLPSQVFSCE